MKKFLKEILDTNDALTYVAWFVFSFIAAFIQNKR